MIHHDAFIEKTAIVELSAQVGDGCKVWHFSHIDSGAVVGENCSLGQNVYIGKDVVVGNGVKIQNNVSLYTGVTIEDDVFCGASVIFTNDLRPRSHTPKGKFAYIPTLVRRGATLGANSTILCGHVIGENALIGAGSVVTRDVLDGELVVGNPLKHLGWVCYLGHTLDEKLYCPHCHQQHIRHTKGIRRVCD